MAELQEVFEHPMVQELIEQNEFLSEHQELSLRKKLGSKGVSKFKNRIIFKEGTHKGIFYSYDTITSDDVLEQMNGIDLFMAEHQDASPAWVGRITNPKASPSDKTVRGDLEIADSSTSEKLSYIIHNKTGSMGLSPTIDVDKRTMGDRTVAVDPQFVSYSIVLKPTVRETVFHSENYGGQQMKIENLSDEDKKEALELLAKKKKKKDENEDEEGLSLKYADLEKEHTESMEKLKTLEAENLKREVEPLAQLEVDLGRIESDKITERTEILMKMTEGERKILSEQYSWMKQELNLDEPDEDIPPDSEDAEDLSKMNVEQLSAYTAFVKSFMKKHKGANISAAAKAWKKTKKKLSEEALAKKKKYPYPEGVDDKKKYPEKQSVSSESGQKIRQDMSERYTLVEEKEKPIDRFNLSEDQADSNQQFIEFLRKQEGRF